MEVTLAPERWDWVTRAKEIASGFRGDPGVVVQFGDSLTLARPNVAWPLGSSHQTPEETEFLEWAHAREPTLRNGWYLASIHPDADNRHSYTAAIGCSARYLLTGKKRIPPLEVMLGKYEPQIAIYAIGMSDVIRGTEDQAFAKDVRQAIALLESAAVIPIIATITPHRDKPERVLVLNEVLRSIAADRKLPLLDLHAGITSLGGEELLQSDGVHLTWKPDYDAPSHEEFRRSGYLFRSWAVVRKVMEVRSRAVEDTQPAV